MSSLENPNSLDDQMPARHFAEPQRRFVAPTIAELAPHFPQLEILEFTHEDRIGATYKVRQRELDRLATLKILRIEVGSDDSFNERFHAKAAALAKLNHPNIAAIHDFGLVANWYFVLTEAANGSCLRQIGSATKVAPERALIILPQVCDALNYAHQNGIVHGDLKPESIFISVEDHVTITDLGVTRLAEREQPTTDVENRADLRSLGNIVFKLLTGASSVAPLVTDIPTATVDDVQPAIASSKSQEDIVDAAASVFEAKPSSPTQQSATDELQLPANVLITLGVCELLSIPLSILTAAWMQLFVVLLWSVSAAAIGSVTVLAGLSLKRQQNYGLTAVGLAISAIPSLLWLIKIPFLALAFNELRKPAVRLAFEDVPWAENAAWATFRKYALGTKEAARYASIAARHLARVCAIPVKWFQLNPQVLWSGVFAVTFISWTAFCFLMSAFAAHADELRQGLIGQPLQTATLLRVTLIALLPYVFGSFVLGRHCRRRFRRSQVSTWKEHMAGPTDAMLSLLVISLIGAGCVSVQTSLSQWLSPGQPAESVVSEPSLIDTSTWQQYLPSGSLNMLYFGYAIFTAFILLLLPWRRPKTLTQILLVVGLGIIPIGMMTLAGNAIQLSFFWSLLLPIWLAIPAAAWALVNLTLPPKAI